MRLMLMPGMDGTGRLFAPLLARLPAAIEPEVIAYPTDEPLGYDELLARVRPQCPQGGAWWALGESFSGPLALRLAAERPPGLRGVILAASFVTRPFAWAPRWTHGLAQPTFFDINSWSMRVAARMLGVHRCPPEVAAMFRSANGAVAPAVLACRARATLEVDLRAYAPTLAGVPVLALVARSDRVLGGAAASKISTLLPHAKIEWFDAPHLLLQACPEAAAASISGFIRAGGWR